MRLARWMGVVGMTLGLSGWLGVVRGAREQDESRPTAADELGIDCGVKALYFLLHFEGHPVNPTRIIATLDAATTQAEQRREGRSMIDLRDGARRLGVRLDGIQWSPVTMPPPGNMIAFLDRPPHGHFVAIRPVGHTGKLVQVFDGEAEPEVIDATRLPSLVGWTGLVLTPHSTSQAVWGGGIAIALGILAWPLARRCWNRRPTTVVA